MGNDIRETSVDFNTRKKLTHEQLKEVIKYCKHDVEQTIQVFMKRFEEFQSHIAFNTNFDLPMKNISKNKSAIKCNDTRC